MYFNISVLFVVNTTFILKLVFPTAYCFCLDGRLGGYVVANIVPAFIVVFTYLFIYFIYLFIIFSIASTVILIFVVIVVIATVAFVVGVIASFCLCVCVWLLLLLN